MERDPLRRREIYEKAKSFEERVAELFRLQGFRAIVDYKRDDMQFDVRLEMTTGALPIFALVECKDLGQTVTQKQVREFASKVETARDTEKVPYQPILVARSGFANNAYAVAQTKFVRLLTFEQLLLSLVDLGPTLEAAIRVFEGTPLERLYVEQDAVLETEIRPGEPPEPKGLTKTVLEWLDRPSSTFLALLGDFGCGKTSFSKRLAWDLATRSKEKPGEARIPILIDLREGGSTTVTLENLLTHHFQRLSSQAFNPQALLHLNREGYLLLIFDGFDETIAYTEPGRYLENLRQILRAAEGKAKVLLTCRTHYFRDRPEALKRLGRGPEMASSPGATKLYEEIQERAGAEVCYVLEFREPQIEEYLQKALSPPTDWRAFREQIRQTYNLEELAERPFLLEIIVKTLPRLLERGSEITLADLYETYCESWFAHTDFRLTLTRDHKVELVEYLARLIWDSPENRVHYTVLADKAAEFFKDRLLTAYDKERIDYEVRTALFLHRDPEGYYSFIHRSFLEFFISRTIRKGFANADASCLDLKRITREVAFFLEFCPEAKRIPDIAGKILETDYQAKISENSLFLLYFHAQASLGPLIDLERKTEEDILLLHDAFLRIRPNALYLQGANLTGALLPGIDLHNAQLDRANLSQAGLSKANLDGARLSQAVLSLVDLRWSSVEGADLSGADLNHLNAKNASFSGTILNCADLSFARLSRSNLLQADLQGAKMIGTGLLQACLPDGVPIPKTAGSPQPKELSLRPQFGHSLGSQSLAWNPEGTILAVGSQDGFGSIILWDVMTGQTLDILWGHNDFITLLAWSRNGKYLASASGDHTVKIWDPESGKSLITLKGHDGLVTSLTWTPNGNTIISASEDNTIRLWDQKSGQLIRILTGHKDHVLSVSCAPDGYKFASTSKDTTICIWTLNHSNPIKIFTGHNKPVNCITWHPDGGRIASASDDNTIKIWDVDAGRIVHVLHEEGEIRSVSWSPDGQQIASAARHTGISIWDANSGRHSKFLATKQDAWEVAWSPSGKKLAAALSRNVHYWDFESALENTLYGHDYEVNSVAWSPCGKFLSTASSDGSINFWAPFLPQPVRSIKEHTDWVYCIDWSPDGLQLASASGEGNIEFWEFSSGRLLRSFKAEKWVSRVTWSPNGKQLAASCSNDFKIFNLESGQVIPLLPEEWNPAIAWSPDGSQIASGSRDGSIFIWNPISGQCITSLQSSEKGVRWISWSPDGHRLASKSYEGAVMIWNLSTGQVIKITQDQGNLIDSVEWNPNGRALATCSNNIVMIWNPETGKLIHSLHVGGLPFSLSWHPKGNLIAISLALSCTEIWEVESACPSVIGRLYHTPGGSGFAATPDGYVSGPPEALETVRFGEGWALYDLTDLPERISPERVAAAFRSKKRKPEGPRKRRRKE